MSLELLFAQLLSLAGVGVLIAMIVNLLKAVNVVKDGDAQNWSAGLNLIALAALFALNIYAPDKVAQLNGSAQALAQILQPLIAVIGMIASSKVTHSILRGTFILGKSNTESQ